MRSLIVGLLLVIFLCGTTQAQEAKQGTLTLVNNSGSEMKLSAHLDSVCLALPRARCQVTLEEGVHYVIVDSTDKAVAPRVVKVVMRAGNKLTITTKD